MDTKFVYVWDKLKKLNYKIHSAEPGKVTFIKIRRFGTVSDGSCIKMDRYVTLYSVNETIEYSVRINGTQWQCSLSLNPDNTLNTERSRIYVFSEFGGLNHIQYTLSLNSVNEDICSLFYVLNSLNYHRGLTDEEMFY